VVTSVLKGVGVCAKHDSLADKVKYVASAAGWCAHRRCDCSLHINCRRLVGGMLLPTISQRVLRALATRVRIKPVLVVSKIHVKTLVSESTCGRQGRNCMLPVAASGDWPRTYMVCSNRSCHLHSWRKDPCRATYSGCYLELFWFVVLCVHAFNVSDVAVQPLQFVSVRASRGGVADLGRLRAPTLRRVGFCFTVKFLKL
jgi:hypothetical protein